MRAQQEPAAPGNKNGQTVTPSFYGVVGIPFLPPQLLARRIARGACGILGIHDRLRGVCRVTQPRPLTEPIVALCPPNNSNRDPSRNRVFSSPEAEGGSRGDRGASGADGARRCELHRCRRISSKSSEQTESNQNNSHCDWCQQFEATNSREL